MSVRIPRRELRSLRVDVSMYWVFKPKGPAKFWLLGSCKELEKFTLKFWDLFTSAQKWKAGGVRAEMQKGNLHPLH